MQQKLRLVLLLLVSSVSLYGQLQSGKYDSGLNLAYNPTTELITGYFEQYSGFDDNDENPRFSCIFYIIGTYAKGEISIKTFYPLEEKDDLIAGKLKVDSAASISIKLNDDHGGCWNVWPFKYEYSRFTLEQAKDWIEIRYATVDKVFFYSDKSESTIRRAYVVKGDVVYIDKVDGEWAHCTYYGKNITSGWIKAAMLNMN